MPVLVKDGKPCSAGSGNSGVLGGVGGGVGVGAGGLHDVSGGGHHDHSDVGGMSNLLDVGLTGHHPSTGHHFHHGKLFARGPKNYIHIKIDFEV